MQFRARGAERMSSGELGSAKLSLYAAIPEILRSRSACQELDGLERGPLIGRGCAPRNGMAGMLGRSMEGWEELEGRPEHCRSCDQR